MKKKYTVITGFAYSEIPAVRTNSFLFACFEFMKQKVQLRTVYFIKPN